LFSGFAIYLVEEDVAKGILLSTFGSAIVLLLVSSIGSLVTLYNLKYFSKKKIGDMYQALTKLSIETH
jgi:NADH:ubiquinone oxidoreductase subunit 5 (subunit L)/multisubunit Na+/H+ antiporter MnhA subunit